MNINKLQRTQNSKKSLPKLPKNTELAKFQVINFISEDHMNVPRKVESIAKVRKNL